MRRTLLSGTVYQRAKDAIPRPFSTGALRARRRRWDPPLLMPLLGLEEISPPVAATAPLWGHGARRRRGSGHHWQRGTHIANLCDIMAAGAQRSFFFYLIIPSLTRAHHNAMIHSLETVLIKNSNNTWCSGESNAHSAG